MDRQNSKTLGVVEGYYGEPLAHEARLDLVDWLATKGFNAYAYGPKDDPYHRDRWREAYPDDEAARLREFVSHAKQRGVDPIISISPGLDYKPGDETELIKKLESFTSMGVARVGIAWDDVPAGGAELGEVHGNAINRAVEHFGNETRWLTVPTDYATAHATEYLKAFVGSFPERVEVAWTGPSIIPIDVSRSDIETITRELGRKVLFGENFPVNDGGMSCVAHLGPYPKRDEALVHGTTGVLFNFMSMAEASKVGLACAARFWTDPTQDRTKVWEEELAQFPGLEPLARACRSWVGDAGPDPWLLELSDGELRNFLEAGCKNRLSPKLKAELAPWVEAFEVEATAMLCALDILSGVHVAEFVFVAAEMWKQAVQQRIQTFGIRFAHYPVTSRVGDAQIALPASIVRGQNLTDLLCQRAFESLSS